MEELSRRKEFNFLWTRKAPFKTIVAARGSGKTVATLQYTVERLLKGKANGSAIFFSGTLKQAKKTIEPTMRLICSNFPEGFVDYNRADLTYSFKISKRDVRTLFMLSYTNENEKRGFHPQTIVLDECANMPASMFGYVIMPMLNEKGSELIAIGTPQGQDKFYELYQNGLSEDHPEWESYMIKASENPYLFDPEYLKIIKENYTESEYLQEYECSFDANVLLGSVYGEHLNKFTKKNISKDYGWDPNEPVYTAWDLGFTDYTSIWFYQKKGDKITFIDYYENSGQTPAFYADILRRLPYNIDLCFLPHDGISHKMEGAPVSEQLKHFGYDCVIIPKDLEQNGINIARTLLKSCRFDKASCDLGLQRLYNFKYRINPKTGLKMSITEHDENSHGADAFRYAAQSVLMIPNKQKPMIRGMKDFDVLA